MGDFNLDLLKYRIDINTADFFDQIYSTVDRSTSNKRSYKNKCKIKTLISNMISTYADKNLIFGNIVTTIVVI